MLRPDNKPKTGGKLGRHISAASVDTNASGLAESTISLGLSRFPEPPSSIPTTPIGSTFSGSPSRTTFNGPSLPPTAPLRTGNSARTAQPPNTYARYADQIPSFQQPSNPTEISGAAPQASSSSHILSPFDWHDGASSIDVDATEDRLLPTSFITSLLRENKDTLNGKRASVAPSEAYSGFSEMTYPPISRQVEAEAARYNSARGPHGRPQDSRPPPSAYSRPTESPHRISGDSDTLHSLQGYPSIIRTAASPRTGTVPVANVAGTSPSAYRSLSSASQASSTADSDTLRSGEKGFRRISTVHEDGDELIIDYKGYSNQAFSPALPSTAGHNGQFFRNSSQRNQTRDSLHSAKSAAPTFLSRVSSLRRMFAWAQPKPLPPVPRIPDIPIAVEQAHRRMDELAPLPDLVNRAGRLGELLEKGHHYDSVRSFHGFNNPNASYGAFESTPNKLEDHSSAHFATSHKSSRKSSRLQMSGPSSALPFLANPSRRRNRLCVIFTTLIIAALAAIGVGVGLSVGKKKGPQFNCSGNLTGSACNLDATCVCTSTSQCNGLAQSVINLLPVVNQAFQANYTTASAYSAIWLMQGNPSTMNCASQALLVDVGSGLEQASFPNRTQWAQSALLWNAVQTQDPVAAQQMQQAVQSMPWKTLDGDGPVVESSSFIVTAAGYNYNFASQTISQPSGSFVSLGQPSSAQLSKVSSAAQSTLDRMYTFAQASSTQRQNALNKYWTSVLLQRAEDLSVFKSALSVSPVMLPFNASSRAIRNLYTSSPNSPFPPPLSCFPGLTSAQQQQINSVETTVYGLSPISSTNQFDPSCYHNRPIYGVLDILDLRLPFVDSRTGVSKQAALLTRDASSRVVLYNGEIFSTALNMTATIKPSQLDPRHYGTLGLFDHVILRYLSSITDISVATALVQFVLASATKVQIPPDPSSLLFQSLDSLPILEVAVFGDVGPTDLTATVAQFTNPSGSLFFGSDDGTALRNWTVNAIKGPIIWAQNATSSLVVRDKSLADNTITQTWNAISLAIANDVPNIGLANITTTLTGTQDFSQ